MAVFRNVGNIDLPPTYISLGLPSTALKANPGKTGSMCQSALNGPGDLLWLFCGSDFFTYDLRQKRMLEGPIPIADRWAPRQIPLEFAAGIDAACWAGQRFPDTWYMFKGNQFIRLNSSNASKDARMPLGLTLESFDSDGSLVWTADSEFLRTVAVPGQPWEQSSFWSSQSPYVTLHGIRRWNGALWMMRDGNLHQHNFNNGQAVPEANGSFGRNLLELNWPFETTFEDDTPPQIIHQALNPDVAFYGTGAEEEHMFLVFGDQFAQYKDFQLIQVGDLENKFPQMARLFRRKPQLYFVEHYAMENYLGDPVRGRLAETIFTPPRQKTTFIEVIEIVRKATSSLRQNLIQSQDTTTVKDFKKRMDRQQEVGSESESYRYFMDAMFHGDAEANSLWGGEVNAQLAVSGGSDDVRDRFSKSAFDTVSQQVSDSTHEVNYKYTDQNTANQMQSSVLSKREVTFDNSDSDRSKTTQLFEALEPYCSLMTLKNIEICYFDGINQTTLPMDRLPANAANWFVNPAQADAILAYIKRELLAIADVGGQGLNFLDPANPDSLRINRGLRSNFVIEDAEGQIVSTRGIIKSAKETKQTTYGVIPVDTHLV